MKTRSPDYPLIVILFLLIILSTLILSSVSAVFSQEKYGYPTYFLFHQVVYGLAIGIFLGFLAYKIPLSLFRKTAFILFIITLILLGLVFMPKFGFESGGASRWIGWGSVSFQPAEFLKITFILYLAAWLASLTELSSPRQKRTKKHNIILGAFLVIMAILSFFLILQPNIGTLGILFAIALLMYFAAGTPFWHIIFMVLTGTVMILALIKIKPYILSRFLVFLNPEIDPLGIGYQLKQSLIAVGSGGIIGLGLGFSRQKFGFVPQSIGDSIFAIFAEEAGFIGATILVILFLAFVWRGLGIAKRAPDKFSQLTALGITSWICVQAFVNIGVTIGILPLTGVPLPFVSYGGSHLIAELIGVGILLNISKYST